MNVRFQSTDSPLPRPRGGWKKSPFGASWSRTLRDLDRELAYLNARDLIIVADIPSDQIRMDGWPRSSARARTPGITITFESKHGPLRYDCNTYDKYEDNIRAFALTLERLRAIDRYGCTKGEQYAGWRALPPAEGKRIGTGFSSQEAAVRWLVMLVAGEDVDDGFVRKMLDGGDLFKQHYREAAKMVHPDSGGSAEQFAMLQEAKRLIEGAA